MIINVKNMVCQRCTIIVNNILSSLNLEAEYITIGQIRLKNAPMHYKLKQLDAALRETGLEIIHDKRSLIVQKIKNIIFDLVHYSEEPLAIKFSCYLSGKLNYSYAYLSNVFSQEIGMSIERYLILQKIEKVKSMLVAEDLFLSEIASKMNYSSVSHLSNQFKKITGMNASDYKSLKIHPEARMTA
ncbi:MAG: helix-turn-helix transcriptional regulator [Bacteroidetes bacterium]|nr:helix-turn-helix transcriptional regulator [Bacteroidota bacterium]